VDDTREIVTALHRRFPAIKAPRGEDICYATSNRQTAVKEMAADVDAVLVIGSPKSSNSLRLVEVAQREGVRAQLIGRATDIDLAWLDGVNTLGITAGASAPETLVREVVDFLAASFDVTEIERSGVVERMVFKLPRGLEAAAA
jgi:4-hydroxy-3-methylbut-2-enyl diphosphate reductase